MESVTKPVTLKILYARHFVNWNRFQAVVFQSFFKIKKPGCCLFFVKMRKSRSLFSLNMLFFYQLLENNFRDDEWKCNSFRDAAVSGNVEWKWKQLSRRCGLRRRRVEVKTAFETLCSPETDHWREGSCQPVMSWQVRLRMWQPLLPDWLFNWWRYLLQ